MAVYDPKINSLEEYLKVYDGSRAFPLFKGYAHYKMIWDKGLFIPDWSIIRIMFDRGRGDEHYWVTGEFEITGLEHEYHGGKPGKHDPRKVLAGECSVWEAQHLKPIE
jgi:hypothetical protein